MLTSSEVLRLLKSQSNSQVKAESEQERLNRLTSESIIKAAGTSEGSKKGWELRHAGGTYKIEKNDNSGTGFSDTYRATHTDNGGNVEKLGSSSSYSHSGAGKDAYNHYESNFKGNESRKLDSQDFDISGNHHIWKKS